jgi:hypothetical protein
VSAEIVREARHGNRRVARIRCYDGIDGTSIVEAEVDPAGGGQSILRGPYRFATAHEAFRFLQEATLALQYLGCSVA